MSLANVYEHKWAKFTSCIEYPCGCQYQRILDAYNNKIEEDMKFCKHHQDSWDEILEDAKRCQERPATEA